MGIPGAPAIGCKVYSLSGGRRDIHLSDYPNHLKGLQSAALLEISRYANLLVGVGAASFLRRYSTALGTWAT